MSVKKTSKRNAHKTNSFTEDGFVKDLTVFVISSGETTLDRCIEALNEQTVSFKIDIIEGYSPMNVAFQEMLDRCTTDYYVQVDSDMILYPQAIESMYDRIKNKNYIPSLNHLNAGIERIAMLYFPLYDVHLERQIIGVKIYDHRIMKNFPYTSDFSCEVSQMDRLSSAGYTIGYQEPICGLHGTQWTGHQIFERYKRLFQKRQIFGSGNENYEWLVPYPQKFLNSYLQHRSKLDLWAYHGVLAGISQDRSKDDSEQEAGHIDQVYKQLQGLLPLSVKERNPDEILFPIRPSMGQYFFTASDLHRLPIQNDISLRICLVTSELPGFGAHGGIATAFKLLAEELTKCGHIVYVLVLLRDVSVDYSEQRDEYFRNGIRVYVVQVPQNQGEIWGLRASLVAKNWLRTRNFDVVHFTEYGILGFYSVTAKRQGYEFQSTILCVQTHGPAALLIDYNNDYDAEPDYQLIIQHCEKILIEKCDYLISPSCFLLDWFASNSYNLPKKSFVIKNIPPSSAERSVNDQVANEIVFFGKQIELKGVELFCDALDQIDFENIEKVTFLGRSAYVNFQDSLGYIAQRAINWNVAVQFVLDVDSKQAMDFCSDRRKLVVIPSLIENLPYVVMECLSVGANFIAANVGGVSELIRKDDHSQCLFLPTPIDLAACITAHLGRVNKFYQASYINAEISSDWRNFHGFCAKILKQKERANLNAPSLLPVNVSICITHKDRPEFLRNCIDSIEQQRGINAQIIIVDDGSTLENCEALDCIQRNYCSENFTWIRQGNSGLAAARNRAAQEARSDFLFFIDEDDFLLPEACAKMLSVLKTTNADIVVGAYKAGKFNPNNGTFKFTNDNEADYLGVGACKELLFLRNLVGPSFCLMKRESFFSLDGYSSDSVTVYEDWAFYQKAILSGFSIELVSEPLFVYTQHLNQMTRNINHKKALDRCLKNLDQNAIISPYLAWSTYNLRKNAYQKNMIEAWRQIDNSSDVAEIKLINSHSTAREEKLNAVGRIFANHGRSVSFISPQRLDFSAPPVGANVYKEKNSDGGGVLFVASELFKTDPKKAKEYIDKKISTIRFSSTSYKKLVLIRTAINLRLRNLYEAIVGIADAELDESGIDFLSAMFVYYVLIGSLKAAKEIEVDLNIAEEKAYLHEYPDVAAAIYQGIIGSGHKHFIFHGQHEGRVWQRSLYFGDLVVECRAMVSKSDSVSSLPNELSLDEHEIKRINNMHG